MNKPPYQLLMRVEVLGYRDEEGALCLCAPLQVESPFYFDDREKLAIFAAAIGVLAQKEELESGITTLYTEEIEKK